MKMKFNSTKNHHALIVHKQI